MKSMMRWGVISLALVPAVAQASAWNQSQGNGLAIVRADTYRTSTFSDPEGRDTPIGTYRKHELSPYVEYGLTPRLTLGGQTWLVMAEQPAGGVAGAAREENFGLGDTELFARWSIYQQGPWAFSVAPLIKLPSASDKDDFPAIGGDQADAELRLLAGYGFDWLGQHHFVNVEGAYRSRFDDPADQIRFDVTLGVRPQEHWLVLVQFFTTLSQDLPTAASLQIAPGQDYDLSKLQLSVVYDLSAATKVEAGGYMDAYARNTGEGGGAFISLWRTF